MEEFKFERMSKEVKRSRSDKQSQPKSKKRFFNQDAPMVNKDGVSNPNSQKGNRSGSSFEIFRCAKCGKSTFGEVPSRPRWMLWVWEEMS